MASENARVKNLQLSNGKKLFFFTIFFPREGRIKTPLLYLPSPPRMDAPASILYITL